MIVTIAMNKVRSTHYRCTDVGDQCYCYGTSFRYTTVRCKACFVILTLSVLHYGRRSDSAWPQFKALPFQLMAPLKTGKLSP